MARFSSDTNAMNEYDPAQQEIRAKWEKEKKIRRQINKDKNSAVELQRFAKHHEIMREQKGGCFFLVDSDGERHSALGKVTVKTDVTSGHTHVVGSGSGRGGGHCTDTKRFDKNMQPQHAPGWRWCCFDKDQDLNESLQCLFCLQWRPAALLFGLHVHQWTKGVRFFAIYSLTIFFCLIDH